MFRYRTLFFLSLEVPCYPEYATPDLSVRKEVDCDQGLGSLPGTSVELEAYFQQPVIPPRRLRIAKWFRGKSQACAGVGRWDSGEVPKQNQTCTSFSQPFSSWPDLALLPPCHTQAPLPRTLGGSPTGRAHIPSAGVSKWFGGFSISGSFSKEANISKVNTGFLTDTSFPMNSFPPNKKYRCSSLNICFIALNVDIEIRKTGSQILPQSLTGWFWTHSTSLDFSVFPCKWPISWNSSEHWNR